MPWSQHSPGPPDTRLCYTRCSHHPLYQLDTRTHTCHPGHVAQLRYHRDLGHRGLASLHISVGNKCSHTDSQGQPNIRVHSLVKSNKDLFLSHYFLWRNHEWFMNNICKPRIFTCNGVRFGYKSWKTSADRITLTVGSAGGTRSTGARVTWIWLLNTPLIVAHITILTIRIYHTFWSTS